MVSLFFGLPGSGKTTVLASLALKFTRKHSRYDHVYSNVFLDVPGVKMISNDDIGRYDLSYSAILIDEATLFADSRGYKEFPRHVIQFFLLHRHYHCDIFLFTQQWDGVDRKIRVITDRVFYIYKTPILGHWFSFYYRVPYGIIIPDPKKNQSGEKLGDIIQGYCRPSFLQRLFCSKVFRPHYYRYFDSFDAPPLPPLPSSNPSDVSRETTTVNEVTSAIDFSIFNGPGVES